MPLSHEDVDRIATLLHQKLRAEREAHWIEPETHAEQHRFLTEWLDDRRRRRQSWQRVKESVLGWLIITVIGGALLAAGTGVYQWLVEKLAQQ